MEAIRTAEQIDLEIKNLQQKLEEANDTIEAIRTGQVDALVIKDKEQHLVYTLKSADQTYRVFIEKMNEGAITLNIKGMVLYSNSRFAAMVNLSLPKIIGSYFENYITHEYKQAFNKLVKNGWQKESKREMYLLPQGKDSIPVLISVNTLELEEGQALSLIVTDLTAQKKIEKELKEKNELLQAAQAFTTQLNNELEIKVKKRTKELSTSREYFKFLADTIPVIVWTATPNGEYDYFNQQWYDYTGKTFKESVGSGWKSVIHPDDLQAGVAAWDMSLKTGEPYKIEDRKKSADGVYRWHICNALPFKDAGGNIVAWFGVCTDIEDQKKALEKKDEFIAMASHELKTPVTSLKAVTQLLMITLENENAMAFSMLTKMDKQITKLTGLIDDLLDVSKANSGQLTFQNEKIDFNELIKETADEMQRTAPAHEIELRLGNTEIIDADRNRIGQVIINLVSNAIKYSPKTSKVIITSECTKDEVKFSVQDFGIGIPLTQQSKIFTRFFRVANDRINTYPGLGLGLYISNEIIKCHFGVLGFKSTEGKGSTFYFTLPVHKAVA